MMPSKNIGLLVNGSLYRGIPQGRTGYENIDFYEECAYEYGLTPIYFRLKDVSLKAGHVRALVKENGSYKLQMFPIPRVVHNRAIFLGNPRAAKKIEALCKQTGTIVFNRWNRYSKWHIHHLMMKHPELRHFLPDTAQATPESVRAHIRKHEAVIIKPSSSSLGRGVVLIKRSGRGWQITYPVTVGRKKRSNWKTALFRPNLPLFLRKKIRIRQHIVQERVKLASYDGRPFDLRVSVQRGMLGMWQLTGIVAKVAKKDTIVTNVAQGGTACQLEEALRDQPHLNLYSVRESIERLTITAAEHLSAYLPSLSDIGFDIGLTPEGKPVFIEMNLRDQRYSFRESGMIEEWKQTYANPIAFAKYLLDGGEPNLSRKKQ